MYRLNRRNNPREKRNNNRDSQLVDYIFDTIDISRYKYEILEDESSLPKLFEKKYYLTPNLYGSSSLLVFTKLQNRFCSFVVNRKTLSYSKDKVNYSKVDLREVSVNVDSSFYNGTIFDGTHITKNNGRDQTFVISDIYTFKGSDYSGMDLPFKIRTIKSCFMNTSADLPQLKRNNRNPKLGLIINQIYKLDKIKDLVEGKIEGLDGWRMRGLSFYPVTSGVRLLYLFKDEQKATIRKTVSVSKSKKSVYKTKTKVKKFVSTKKGDTKAVLEMKKTEKSGVYNLSSIKEKFIKGVKKPTRVSMGIAYIPDAKKTKKCKKWIDKSSKGRVLIECKFHERTGKWEPLDIVKGRKKPDLFDDIEIEIVEVTVSEEDE